MKKLVFVALVILGSCSSSTYMMNISVANFSEYNKAGFLITTSSISSKYQALGLVSVECQPGYYPVKKEDSKLKGDDLYYSTHIKPANYADCNKQDITSSMYDEAIKLGANGLIDVKFGEYAVKTDTGYKLIYTATGLAVKIGN